MFFLLKHYRSPINFSEDRILEAQNALERIVTTLANINLSLEDQELDSSKAMPSLAESIDDLKQEFIDEMDDDFNSAGAIAKVFDLIKEANLILARNKLEPAEAGSLLKIKQTIEEFDSFLGILFYKEAAKTSIKEETLIKVLIDVRTRLRVEKQWALADFIRDELDKIGIELKDRPDKTTWVKKITQ